MTARRRVTFNPRALFEALAMRERAHEVPLGDVIVPIAHRDDLITLKRAAGRPQDLADIRLLESLDERG